MVQRHSILRIVKGSTGRIELLSAGVASRVDVWHHRQQPGYAVDQDLNLEVHVPRSLLTLFAFIVIGSGCSEPPPSRDLTNDPPPVDALTPDPRLQFVGNWELVGRERITADGELLPTPDPPLPGADGEVGYIMYDAAGYMGVVIMPPGRPPYASDRPTGEEAVGALGTYTSYFGTYTVNEAEGYLTHHLQGNVRPPDSANNNQRFYEFSGNQLILMPPPDDSGIKRRITWQRVPDLPEEELTETHRRLFGFYRFSDITRTTVNGESVLTDQWDDAFVIYMPSGHMAVHISRQDRPVYTGAPTPEQALEAVQTYGSYFGPFSVHEEEGYLIHHRNGNLNPGQAEIDAQRFFDLNDTSLTLRPPPQMVEGRELQSAITWERISE